MRTEGGAPDQALPVADVALTCNHHPLKFSSTHPTYTSCGKPAVARIPLGISGQLTVMILCQEHLDEAVANVPNIVPFVVPV